MSWLFDPVVLWAVAARLSGAIVALPGLPSAGVPRPVRAAIVIWLTIFVAPWLEAPGVGLQDTWGVATLLGGEFMIGLGYAFTLRLFVSAAEMGAAMIENELGLTAAQQFNPILGQQAGVIVSLWGLIATAYFWLLDFIPLALATLLTSFDLVPLGVFTLASVHEVIAVASRVFGGALIVAAPVVAVGFAVNLALAFAAKSIQQFNVFSEGFAIRLAAVGAGLLGLLPVLLLALRSVLEDALPSAARWLGSISSS